MTRIIHPADVTYVLDNNIKLCETSPMILAHGYLLAHVSRLGSNRHRRRPGRPVQPARAMSRLPAGASTRSTDDRRDDGRLLGMRRATTSYDGCRGLQALHALVEEVIPSRKQHGGGSSQIRVDCERERRANNDTSGEDVLWRGIRAQGSGPVCGNSRTIVTVYQSLSGVSCYGA